MNSKFDNSNYNDKYYGWFDKNTRTYITETMSWFIDTYKPESIIDFGCGIGAYLEVGLKKGLKKIKGYDINGEILKKYTNPKIFDYVEYIDCTEPIKTNEKYFCSISIETGEHIETNKSDNLVKNITDATSDKGYVLFSAAKPGQNGTGHINCQPKIFWIKKFNNYNFFVDEKMTKLVSEKWKTLKSPKYIYENLIIFKKNEKI